MSQPAPAPIDPRTRIGHVHLKVADLARALAFYRDVLGFELTQRFGPGAAFLSAGGYHHHLGLNVWESRGGGHPHPGRPASTTWRSSIRHAPPSATRSAVSSPPASPSMEPPTTASPRRSICATRTATASSSTATARSRNGRVTPTATWQWSPSRSTSPSSPLRSTPEPGEQL